MFSLLIAGSIKIYNGLAEAVAVTHLCFSFLPSYPPSLYIEDSQRVKHFVSPSLSRSSIRPGVTRSFPISFAELHRRAATLSLHLGGNSASERRSGWRAFQFRVGGQSLRFVRWIDRLHTTRV